MPVITMNVPCLVERRGEANLYNEESFAKPTPSKCAVVKLLVRNERTSVRTDSSGTHGHADETTIDGKLLMSKNEKIALGDKITVQGQRMTVVGVHPRYNVWSRIDHIEVETRND
jgi:hypothetical protein